MSDKLEKASKLPLFKIFVSIFYLSVLALIARNYAPVVEKMVFPYVSVEKDVKQLLEKHQMKDIEVTCNAIRRLAQCMLKNPSFSLDKLITGLKLKDFNSVDERNSFKYYNYWLDYQERRERYDLPFTCGSLPAFENLESVKVYGVLDRSSELVIPNGGAFEHFFLFHHLDTNEACIHFTYAYG